MSRARKHAKQLVSRQQSFVPSAAILDFAGAEEPLNLFCVARSSLLVEGPALNYRLPTQTQTQGHAPAPAKSKMIATEGSTNEFWPRNKLFRVLPFSDLTLAVHVLKYRLHWRLMEHLWFGFSFTFCVAKRWNSVSFCFTFWHHFTKLFRGRITNCNTLHSGPAEPSGWSGHGRTNLWARSFFFSESRKKLWPF